MNRTDRRAVDRLPTSLDGWEALAVGDAEPMPDGTVIEGMLVICEARSGTLRALGPLISGIGAEPLVRDALLAPPEPGTPARPSRVVCGDARTRDLLREVLGDLVPVVVGPTPAAEQGFAELHASFSALGPPEPPGVDHDLESWRRVFHALCEDDAWRDWSVDAAVRFAGDPVLAEGAIYLGEVVEIEEFVFSPTGRPPEDDDDVWQLLFTPAERDPDAVDAARRGGWCLPGDLLPVVFGGVPPFSRKLTSDEERRFLAALQALAALARDGGDRPVVATTALGPLEARLEAPMQWLTQGDVLVRSDPEGAEVALKMTKREAQRAATLLREVVALRLLPRSERSALVGERLGRPPLLLAEVVGAFRGDRLAVALYSGGTTSGLFRDRELLVRVALPLIAQPAVVVGPEKPAGDVLAALVQGVVAPGQLARMPVEAVDRLVRKAANVFSAVSEADHGGDTQRLGELRAKADEDLLVDLLIAEKRRSFGDDHRTLSVSRVGVSDGELWVEADALGGDR